MCDESNVNERLFFVWGNEKGRLVWYYIMVERFFLGLFLKWIYGGKLDVNNFGIIIWLGLGEFFLEVEIIKNLNKLSEFWKDFIGKIFFYIVCEIENGNFEVIEFLVKYGGEINVWDGDGFILL